MNTMRSVRGSLRHRLVVVMIGLVALSLLVQSARAATADQVCSDVAKKAGRTLWSSMRESGDSMFCRKSWLPGEPDELGACSLWTKANLYTNKVQNLWNNIFSGAGWATWNPRGIGPDWEQGTIQLGAKRTFFGAALAYSKTTVEVVKEGGKAQASVTVCTLNYDGEVASKEQKNFPSGQGGENTSVKFTLTNNDNRILGVVVDTPVEFPGVTFEYRAHVLTEPIRNNLGAVRGIADLHVHEFAELGFGGRLFWGLSSGPIANALHKEEISPTGTNFDLTSPVSLLQQLATPGASLDANVLFKVFGGPPQSDGFFQYGGEGYPSFKDWPHHADRSHHGVYLDWLKEAHERNKDTNSNLKLIVVSIVNNDILCSVAKVFDNYGNVPIYGAGGIVTGWESKNWGCSDHENVVRQLNAMHEIEKANKWYRIAMNPWHARQIIADGDLAVVASLETDKPLSSEGNNYGNWENQLDFYRALGVSTTQIVHESDSIFCGAALHRNEMAKLQAIHWPLETFSNIFTGHTFDVDANGFNKKGLTDEGRKLIDAMIKRNMPIDLAHTSQKCRTEVLAKVGTDYGMYDSHTKFQSLLTAGALEREQEFLITPGGLADYKRYKIVVGLRPAPIDLKDAQGNKVANNCPGSSRSFAQMVQFASDQGLSFALGSDFNSGTAQLSPRFPGGTGRCYAARQDLKKDDLISPDRASKDEGLLPARAKTVAAIAGTNYYTHGVATIGWEPELVVDLDANLHAPGADKLRNGAEAYLQMWQRTYPAEATPVVAPGSVVTGGSCTSGDQCKAGRCTGVAGAKGVCVCNEDADCSSTQYVTPALILGRTSARPRRPTMPLARWSAATTSANLDSARSAPGSATATPRIRSPWAASATSTTPVGWASAAARSARQVAACVTPTPIAGQTTGATRGST